MESTQFNHVTQSTQRPKVKVEDLIKEFLLHSKTAGNKEPDEVDEKVSNFVGMYYAQLEVDNRRIKLFNYASKSSDLFPQFVTAWLNLLRFAKNGQDGHRLAALRAILCQFETQPVSVHNFVTIYNILCSELSKVNTEGVISLVNFIQKRVNEPQNFLKRWKDCVLVLLKHLATLEVIKEEEAVENGKTFVARILRNLLENARSFETFRHILCIAKDLNMPALIETFLTENVLEKLEEERFVSSWKAIAFLEHIDPKLSQRIFLALNSVWRSEEETLPEILPLFPFLKIIFEEFPATVKVFSILFKQRQEAILSSQFGLLTLVFICGIERYRTQAIQDIKNSFLKLWKFGLEIEKFGWLQTTEINCTMETVKRQMTGLIEYFGTNGFKKDGEDYWPLFRQALLQIGFSLVDSSIKEVTIVEGRVIDDGSVCIFGKKILIEILLAHTESIPTQLEPIVHAIASSGNNGSAFVLIDVLVEIVKKCAVEVLNNSKLIDGLFDYICKMKRDVGVSLIRCLLPIINQRAKLRETLFRNLKQEMLNESSVGSAIPILILLLRSVSKKKCLLADPSSNFSQSFASFSSQSLQMMGVKSSVDDSVALEIVGILKRCLTQPATTKVLLYEELVEAASRCPSLLGPCLDLLTDHASTVPAWTPETMVISGKSLTQLREPLPQLVQTIECLCFEAISAGPAMATQAGDLTIQKANDTLSKWIEKAVSDDVHDLAIDKLSEWNPNNLVGRANFVFANMMLSLYDVFLEHVWREYVVLKRGEDREKLTALLRRRHELEEVLSEKTVKRKEAKIGTTESTIFDVSQGDISSSGQVIASLLEQLVKEENEETTEKLGDVREDLLAWSIERALKLSKDLLRTAHSLHSPMTSARHLVSIAHHLLDLYIGVDCAKWIQNMATDNPMKTKAIETYANICRLLCSKYKSTPDKITTIWQKEQNTQNSQGVATCLVRHVHLLMSKLLPALLKIELGENKKRGSLELEKQAKALSSASTNILLATSNCKAFNATFKFLTKVLVENTFDNNAILKDFLTLWVFVGQRSSDTDIVFKESYNLTEDVVQVLSDEGYGSKFACIDRNSYGIISDFLISLAHQILLSIKDSVNFAGDFFSKDLKLDILLQKILKRVEECGDILSRLLPLHTQFHVQKERLVVLLTTFFTAIEAPVHLMLSNHKLIPEIADFKSFELLASFLKKKAQLIMAIADEKVGTFCHEEAVQGATVKRRYAKAKKEETIYVKYVRARENLQSLVLQLSKALKDDRLNLQIKNNSIGIRDFRLDTRVLEERIASANEESPAPKKKRRRTTGPEDRENNDTTTSQHNNSTVY